MPATKPYYSSRLEAHGVDVLTISKAHQGSFQETLATMVGSQLQARGIALPQSYTYMYEGSPVTVIPQGRNGTPHVLRVSNYVDPEQLMVDLAHSGDTNANLAMIVAAQEQGFDDRQIAGFRDALMKIVSGKTGISFNLTAQPLTVLGPTYPFIHQAPISGNGEPVRVLSPNDIETPQQLGSAIAGILQDEGAFMRLK